MPHCYWNVYASPPPPAHPLPPPHAFFFAPLRFCYSYCCCYLVLVLDLGFSWPWSAWPSGCRTLVNWPKSSTLFTFLSVCLVPGCFLVPARRERALFPLAAHLLTHTYTHTLPQVCPPLLCCVFARLLSLVFALRLSFFLAFTAISLLFCITNIT